MIEEKLYFEWICYTRADAIGDAEMLSLMKEAGCYLIVVGIESGNERTLELLNKKLDLDVARKNIQLANNVGINVLSSFMLGIPGDTREVIEQTIKFSQDIGLTYATFPIFTPYPGTPIYDVALEVGVLEKDNFDEFSRWGDGVYSYGNMNPDVFRELQRKAFLGFYLRPRIIWKMFLDVLKLPWRRKIRFIRGGILQLLGWLFYKNAQRKV